MIWESTTLGIQSPGAPRQSAHYASSHPSIDRITACMVQKRASLSAGCKSVFQVPAAGKAATVASKSED